MSERPYPGSRSRTHRDDRTTDISKVEKFAHVVEWMHEKGHGVTSRDMWEDDVADTPQQASRTLGGLYDSTRLVDRVEFRQRTDDGNKNVAHVYWLTDAGKASIEALEQNREQ